MSGMDGREALRALRVFGVLLAVAVLVASAVVLSRDAQGQELLSPQENAWAREWIPAACCVTSNCCYRVEVSELQSLPDDRWRVVATGQVLGRTGYSRDGHYWRCSCERQATGVWLVHPAARTFCVFTPLPMF